MKLNNVEKSTHLNITLLINPGIKQRINSTEQFFFISKEMRDKRARVLLPCQRKFCRLLFDVYEGFWRLI